jgi:isoleucyl-tRNA synthetase
LLSLTKLVAPILPHTADEVWSHISSVAEDSVQLTDFPEFVEHKNSEVLLEKWTKFMQLRDDVLKALEEARNQKVIGKSLAAKITLYVSEETNELLNSIQENLKQLFIVSGFEVAGEYELAPENALKLEHAAIIVSKADGETCERCWTVTTDIGNDNDHPTLCVRCASVVKENYSELA